MAKKKKTVKRPLTKAKVRKPVKLAVTRKKKPVKHKDPPAFKRYRQIQSILSAYNKEHGLKPGRDIYKQASEIYRRTKGSAVKFIGQNIDRLYEDYIKPPEIKTEFPDLFPFFSFSEKLNFPKFDGVTISIFLNDGMEEFSFEGYRLEVDAYYRQNIHAYLRKNYNSSPVAVFRIENTDQRTFVNYVIETGKGIMPTFLQEPVLPEQKPIPKQELPKLPTEQNIKEQIEFEKAKESADVASEKKMRTQIELITTLRDAGLTAAEIKKYLGI